MDLIWDSAAPDGADEEGADEEGADDGDDVVGMAEGLALGFDEPPHAATAAASVMASTGTRKIRRITG
ncbi:MAG TPA: hypothetical protein VKV80_08580 [Streptosporangiaceae bacterium]|nr:hypothetical protein [Streptosporangiaceae bacterium]